jgi:hypothetical protein
VQLFPIIDVVETFPSESMANDPAPLPAMPPLDVTSTRQGSAGFVCEAAHEITANNIIATTESFIAVSTL